MIKKNWIYFLFAFSVIAYSVSAFVLWKNEKKIEAKSIKTENGWGYEVYVGHKRFILQKTIPSLSGTKSFSSEEDALKVANLVVIKMKQQHKLPNISEKELDSLGITK